MLSSRAILLIIRDRVPITFTSAAQNCGPNTRVIKQGLSPRGRVMVAIVGGDLYVQDPNRRFSYSVNFIFNVDGGHTYRN